MNLIYPDQLPTYHVHHHICAWCSVHLSWGYQFIDSTRTVFCSLVSMLYWSLIRFIIEALGSGSFISKHALLIYNFLYYRSTGQEVVRRRFSTTRSIWGKVRLKGVSPGEWCDVVIDDIDDVGFEVDVGVYVDDDLDVYAQDNDAAARSMSSSRASSVMGSTSAVRFVQIFYIQIFCYQISW